ncbi:hypothetical protein WOLCODRAFT_92076 [Wolfiporia cocos MD-104 SS10]|uniref:TM7S3/TM198-like domain-containing protein n=1 Tax=Wolfiporia cocos (strain MD-104) TaxID=742152 RepID=A0A2H3J2Y0_WOLCO|nr:hypothetical protein WOLCODRAFT_92076 [Wolfiporia cocos MD-104 SS10]
MAVTARLLYTLTWLCLAIATSVNATPLSSLSLHALSARSPPVVEHASNGTVSVVDPSDDQTIAQGSASDGSGTGLTGTAIVWIVYCFVVGVPLAFGGIKFPRVTAGVGVGIAATVCLWAAFINTETAQPVSDWVITLIPVCVFVPGFSFGLFPYGRLAGTILITVASGFSWGARLSLFREDLLVRQVWGDWIIGAAFALINVVLIPHFERTAIALASASVGTFLIGLGIDLLIEKQNGMSWGLRYLFDRNKAHWLNLVYEGYKPTVATYIVLAISLALSLVLAYAQHLIFPDAWRPVPDDDDDLETALVQSAEKSEEKAPIRVAVQDASATPTTSMYSGINSLRADSRPISSYVDESRPISTAMDPMRPNSDYLDPARPVSSYIDSRPVSTNMDPEPLPVSSNQELAAQPTPSIQEPVSQPDSQVTEQHE